MVSYNEKHNLNNGENNRDGDNNNLSWNSGVEGPTNNNKIQGLRSRRIRSMAVILFLSQGVPMLVAGDEFGRSQQGNNNAWCQDNSISWIDWDLETKNYRQLRFFRKLIHLRKSHPIFRREDFFLVSNGAEEPIQILEIIWQGLRPGEQDWSPECRTLAFMLNGSTLAEQEDDDFFVMINGNADDSALFTIPAPSRNRTWVCLIDTGRPPPHDFIDPERGDTVECGSTISVTTMGCVVLQSVETR